MLTKKNLRFIISSHGPLDSSYILKIRLTILIFTVFPKKKLERKFGQAIFFLGQNFKMMYKKNPQACSYFSSLYSTLIYLFIFKILFIYF